MVNFRFQTKFMLANLLMTLLPVVPLYFLIDKFYQTSIEVGLNPQVEGALEGAAGMSQLLFAHYKEALLEIVEAQAQKTDAAHADSKIGQSTLSLPTDLSLFEALDLRALDRQGNVFAAGHTGIEWRAPALSRSEIASLIDGSSARIVPHANSPAVLMAVAPIPAQNGILIAFARTNPAFVRSSHQIVEVNQMFKTIGLLRDDLRQGFVFAFFIVYVPIAALSLLVGYFFAKKVTAPMQILADGTQKIASGDWQHRVEYAAQDELGQLVTAFNRMVEEVKTRQDRVVQLEKMTVWREMARVLAHEIKNPLTPIQLTVQQLNDKYDDKNSAYGLLLKECTDIINDELQNLQQLVREFSEFARMPKLQKTTGSLNELIAETARRYRDLDITTKLDSEVPEMLLDFEKMRRVLINFFDNSRYSIHEKGSGAIVITTQKTGEMVLLRFSDTGTGISEQALAKIFEPHFSTKKSGMGLGLAIVRNIVQEHGGSIRCNSELGRGATFDIELPMNAVAEQIVG